MPIRPQPKLLRDRCLSAQRLCRPRLDEGLQPARVATIIQRGSSLSAHVTPLGFLSFAGLFAPLWFTRTGFTFYTNRFIVDDFDLSMVPQALPAHAHHDGARDPLAAIQQVGGGSHAPRATQAM
jgi:hypothetical protein